jgi:hypothetical protein
MGMEQMDAENLRRSGFIPKELWKKCRGLALIKNKYIGEWVAEAMQEKYNREIMQEASNEKVA